MDEFILFSCVMFGLVYTSEARSPKFLPTATNVTFHVGELAKLPCAISRLSDEQTVAWRKLPDSYPLTIGSMTYTPDTRYSLEYINEKMQISEWNLIIRDVQPEHSGRYECQVTTMKRGMKRHIRLNVIAIVLTGQHYVQKNHPIQLKCNVTGTTDPPKDIDWYKNGRLLYSDHTRGIVITKYTSHRTLYSELIIGRSNYHHSGTYVCESSNLEVAEIPVIVQSGASGNVKRGTELYNDAPPRKEKNIYEHVRDKSGARFMLPELYLIIIVGLVVTYIT